MDYFQMEDYFKNDLIITTIIKKYNKIFDH